MIAICYVQRLFISLWHLLWTMRQALPNENNDTNGRNALAILSSFAGKLMAAMRRSRNECPPGEKERCKSWMRRTKCFLLYSSFSFQPVGFVTFHTRAGAEAAKQDLQVIALFSQASRGKEKSGRRWCRLSQGSQGWRAVDIVYIHSDTHSYRYARQYFFFLYDSTLP